MSTHETPDVPGPDDPGPASHPHGGDAARTDAGQFQVDLRGLVDLLGRHLYSSPRVYVRELLQNGVDALTQRPVPRDGADRRPGVLLVGADASADGRLHCLDSGVGLDADDLTRFLATIGRSGKRDELGLARTDLLGQFGVGLLSCFMVADAVEVVSRKGDGPVVGWLGRSDGTYDLFTPRLDADDPRAAWLGQGTGTCLALHLTRDGAEWGTGERVAALAHEFGRFLPHDVQVRTRSGPASVGIASEDRVEDGTVRVSGGTPPWELPDAAQRRDAARAHARRHWDVEPFDVLQLSVPELGVQGFAAVLPGPSHSGQRVAHEGYARRMLVSGQVLDAVPDWAFFVRCCFDSTQLHLTASREEFMADDAWTLLRERLGEQVRRWMSHLARADASRFARFLGQHQLAVKQMCLDDEDLAKLVVPLLGFESSRGTTTLERLARELPAGERVVRWADNVDEYRQAQPIAAAQGMVLLNAGYVHEAELLSGFDASALGIDLRRFRLDEVADLVLDVDAVRAREAATGLTAVREHLSGHDLDVLLRRFAPASLPAALVETGQVREQRAVRQAREAADDLWSELLGAVQASASSASAAEPRAQLLLNDDNAQVRRLLDAGRSGHLPPASRLEADVLVSRALLGLRRPLTPSEVAAIDQTFEAVGRALATLPMSAATPDSITATTPAHSTPADTTPADTDAPAEGEPR